MTGLVVCRDFIILSVFHSLRLIHKRVLLQAVWQYCFLAKDCKLPPLVSASSPVDNQEHDRREKLLSVPDAGQAMQLMRIRPEHKGLQEDPRRREQHTNGTACSDAEVKTNHGLGFAT